MNDVCYFQFEHLKRDFSYHCAIRAVIKAEIYNIDNLANNMEKVKRAQQFKWSEGSRNDFRVALDTISTL